MKRFALFEAEIPSHASRKFMKLITAVGISGTIPEIGTAFHLFKDKNDIMNQYTIKWLTEMVLFSPQVSV